MTAGVDRLDGFREALRELGRPAPAVAYGSFTRASGEDAMRALLKREPELDAVFAASDMMALGAMSVLKEAGRRIPDDVAVIGFDDVEVGRHTDPMLTTIHQPIAEQARLLVDLLVTQIRTGKAGPIPDLLPTTLVARRSG
jgi:DNA-binding LacI/PurR family transcriptional regulator